MNIKNVIFFPDEPHEVTEAIREELSKSYSCYKSYNVDEFNQVYQMVGKFILLFSEATIAVNFLKNSAEQLQSLNYKTYLCLNKNGKFSPESQKILDNFKINVFLPTAKGKLVESIDSYFATLESNTLDIGEIEFVKPKDDDGTAK
jgi:hypothetical protein